MMCRASCLCLPLYVGNTSYPDVGTIEYQPASIALRSLHTTCTSTVQHFARLKRQWQKLYLERDGRMYGRVPCYLWIKLDSVFLATGSTVAANFGTSTHDSGVDILK